MVAKEYISTVGLGCGPGRSVKSDKSTNIAGNKNIQRQGHIHRTKCVDRLDRFNAFSARDLG